MRCRGGRSPARKELLVRAGSQAGVVVRRLDLDLQAPTPAQSQRCFLDALGLVRKVV